MDPLHANIHGVEKRGFSGARGTAPYIDGSDGASWALPLPLGERLEPLLAGEADDEARVALTPCGPNTLWP